MQISFLITAIVIVGVTNAIRHRDPTKCLIHEIKCKDGSHCIPEHFLCDGSVDCDDRSDEHPSFCSNYTCPPHKTKCGDGTCIHKMIQCDNVHDCIGGGDEHDSVCSDPNYTLGKLKKEFITYKS